MLEMEPWALSMLGQRSATKLHPLSFNTHIPKEQKDEVDHSFKEQTLSSDFSSTPFIPLPPPVHLVTTLLQSGQTVNRDPAPLRVPGRSQRQT